MLWRTLDSYDVWYQLQAGEDILRSGAVPRVDNYSFTRAGEPWLLNAWLSAVVLALIYGLAGSTGLILLKIILGLCFFAGVALLLRQRVRSPELFLLLLLWALMANLRFWPVRAYLFSYLGALAAYWLLGRERLVGRERLCLAVIFVFWCNLHFGFVLALIFALLRVVDRGLRRQPLLADLLFLPLLLLTGLVNPYGAQIYGYAAALNDFSALTMLGEWQPLWRFAAADFPLEYLTAGAVLAGSLWLAVRRQYYQAGVALVLALLSLKAIRFVPYAGSIGILALSCLPLAGPRLARWRPRLLTGAIILALLALVAPAQRDFWRGAFTAGLDPLAFPAGATEFMRGRALPPNLFNEQRWGAWLSYHLHPGYRVFTDGRTDLYLTLFPDERHIRECAPGWQELLDKYRINTVLLATTGHPALRLALAADPAWATVYRDELAVIFVRRDPLAAPPAP